MFYVVHTINNLYKNIIIYLGKKLSSKLNKNDYENVLQ